MGLKRPPETRARLWLNEPDSIVGHDTVVITVAINEPGEAAEAWQKARERLDAVVTGLTEPGIWGQTLIYQAGLPSDVDAHTALEAVLPRLGQLPPPNRLADRAHAEINGGHLWLLGVPLRGEGMAASTVYAALVPGQRERAFVRKVLLGPAALLLLPDLIATKGYFLRRRHLGVDPETGDWGNWDDWYHGLVKRLRDVTAHLLQDLGKPFAETDQVDQLAVAYRKVAEIVPSLKQQHITVLQQVHNLDAEQRRLEDNPVFAFHRRRLEATAYELELKVANGQDAMDAARGASDLAQVSIDREQGQQQYLIQTMLALVTVAFAVPMVVDKPLAGAFIHVLGYKEPLGGYSVWWLALVQIGAIVFFAAIAVLILRAVRFLPPLRRR